jgi:hypothetical protein
MTRASLVRLALFALAGLALFSLLFSVAADNGLWPRLPAGALHDTDLWVGLVAGVALLLLLLRGGTQRTGGRGDGGTGRREEKEKPLETGGASEIPPSPTPPVQDRRAGRADSLAPSIAITEIE